MLNFGKPPWYFPFYHTSCINNKDVGFLFIGYSFNDIPEADNIRKINFSLEDFSVLASHKTGIDINVNTGYKTCDLRPAFGGIFEDFIKEADFWGICDPDIVLGDIRGFLTDEILRDYNYISVKPEYPTGFMSVYRNCPLINNLYR